MRLADCNDWQQANVSERLGTLRELHQFASEPVGSSELKHGRALDDKKAYEIFNNECKASYASDFKLYKLYTRAAAFAGAAVPSQ